MGTRGIVGTAVVTNHLMDAEACLGIEAARATIIREIQTTMSAHGMTIDSRHVMLLAVSPTSCCMIEWICLETETAQGIVIYTCVYSCTS